jgi:hypothetical protein
MKACLTKYHRIHRLLLHLFVHSPCSEFYCSRVFGTLGKFRIAKVAVENRLDGRTEFHKN